MYEINIYIKPSLLLTLSKAWFQRLAQKILSFLDVQERLEVGLVITNNAEIKRLNNKYRGENRSTDVLAFNMISSENKKKRQSDFIKPPDDILHLGEVVISYPQAVIQANERNHSIEHELQILMIHGILHLMGYDHELSARKAQVMKKTEEAILKMLSSES